MARNFTPSRRWLLFPKSKARSYLKRGLRVMRKVHSCKKLMSTYEVNDNLASDFESTVASVGSAALGWKKFFSDICVVFCFLLRVNRCLPLSINDVTSKCRKN